MPIGATKFPSRDRKEAVGSGIAETSETAPWRSRLGKSWRAKT
jgi:hypothetical protein